MRKWLQERIAWPLWLKLTAFLGFNFCIWLNGDEVKVIHLYDNEWNLKESMRNYLL